MARSLVAILLALAFALQPILAVGGAACDCCSAPAAESGDGVDAEVGAHSCCGPATDRDDGVPDRPADHDRDGKCPMSCCSASLTVGLLVLMEPIALFELPSIVVAETLESHPTPTRSMLKRPPRAVTLA